MLPFQNFIGIIPLHLVSYFTIKKGECSLVFQPGKEQAAGVWETCLAPGWPQLRSGLPFGPRSQASLQKAQGPGQ